MIHAFLIGGIVLLCFLQGSLQSPDHFHSGNCSGFPFGFVGCWAITESNPFKDVIFLNSSCMQRKNGTLCGKVMCGSNGVTFLNDNMVRSVFDTTEDPNVLHMTTIKCSREMKTTPREKCRNSTVVLSKMESCSSYFARSERMVTISDLENAVELEETRNERHTRSIHEDFRGAPGRYGYRRGRSHRYKSRQSDLRKRMTPTPEPTSQMDRPDATTKIPGAVMGPTGNPPAAPQSNPPTTQIPGSGKRHRSRPSNGRPHSSAQKPKSFGSTKGRPHNSAQKPKSYGSSNYPPQTFAQKADSTAKKLASGVHRKPVQFEDRRTGKLQKKGSVSRKGKSKFDRKLNGIEKDIAKQQRKDSKNKQPYRLGPKHKAKPFGVAKPKKNMSSFSKSVDSAAAKLAKKEEKSPSLPRNRPSKQPPLGVKQEQFEKKLNSVAKDFAKKDEDSPVAFDRLVNKVAHDLAKYKSNEKGEGDRVYIPRGKTVTLDCVRDEETRSPIPPLRTKWTKDDQKLAEGRYKVTGRGDLKIEEVEAHDNGIFRCDAAVTDKDGKQKSVTRLHKVMVYRVPTVSYIFTIKFKTPGCNSAKSDEALSNFKSKTCSEDSCYLRDVLSKCPGDGKRMYIEGKVALGVEFKSPSDCSGSKCQIKAMKTELGKRMGKVKDFVSKYKSGPGKYGKIINVVYDFIYFCESGYEQNNLMCTPCYPGFYSPPNDPACHRCPVNTYQDNFGGSRCLKCPDGGKTKKPGATSVVNCGHQLQVSLGQKKVKLDRLMLYVGGGVGVLGLLFMMISCCYLQAKIKQNPDVPKKQVVKGEVVKAKKKAGESAKKAKAKAKGMKKKKGKTKDEEQPESDQENDEENENNSNLVNTPLLKSSRPKYDKNSGILRKIEEESVKQTKKTSSRGNINRNNQSSSPGFTSSDADCELTRNRRPVGLKGSMSESIASNTRALQNAALQAKSNDCSIKLVQEKALQKRKSVRKSNSRSTIQSRNSSGVSKAETVLTEGKAKYGSDAYYRLLSNMSQGDHRTASPKSTRTARSFVNSPASSSIYSTPPDKSFSVQNADSWYTADWDSNEDSTIASNTQTQVSNSQLYGNECDTESTNGESWHASNP